jgi:hypothetical protein
VYSPKLAVLASKLVLVSKIVVRLLGHSVSYARKQSQNK